jgi:hypothetical protein
MSEGTNFWGNPTVEPKRSYRWVVSVPGLDGAEWYATKVSKPNFTVNESEHTFLNHKFYYPGRVEWETVSLTLVDPITPDATDQLMRLLGVDTQGGMAGTTPTAADMGYRYPDDYGTAVGSVTTKEAAHNALGVINIRQISGGTGGDTTSTVVEEWKLQRCWIKSVNFGDLDYGSEDLINIELEIRYDWAVLNSRQESSWGQPLAT